MLRTGIIKYRSPILVPQRLVNMTGGSCCRCIPLRHEGDCFPIQKSHFLDGILKYYMVVCHLQAIAITDIDLGLASRRLAFAVLNLDAGSL